MPWDSVDNRLTRNRTLADEIQAQIRRAINHRPAKPSTIGVGALKYTDTTPGSGQRDVAFVDLTDTPDDYAGDTLKVLRVNAGETAVEFIAPASLGLGTSVVITLVGPPITLTTGDQEVGYRIISPQAGTITWLGVYVSTWTPSGGTDTITVQLYVNDVAKDSFTNNSGTSGTKSGTISETIAAGDLIYVLVKVSTQIFSLDDIQISTGACNLTAVVI